MSKVTQALKIIRLEAENARLVAENARLTRERDAAYAAADKFAKLLHDENSTFRIGEQVKLLTGSYAGKTARIVDVGTRAPVYYLLRADDGAEDWVHEQRMAKLEQVALGVERAPLDEIVQISFEGQMRGDVD
jgi:hypothetical protein